MATHLVKSTAVVSTMTASSRILGFVRDMLLAHFFGAGETFDAFVVAFRIPNLFRNLFAEGAFSQAFVPILSDYREHYERAELKRFIAEMSGSLGIILLLLTVVTIVAAPVMVYLFAIGFIRDPVRAQLTANMLRITFPYLMLISLTALAGAILNTWNRFAVPAFTPVLLNLSMIFATLFISHWFNPPIYGLAFGVLLAGFIQLGFQLPFIKRERLLVWPRINFYNPGVKRVFKLMLPALVGVSVTQLGILIDTLFASFLQTGSITWLYYSDRLIYLPLGIFGVAISTVILPHLSREHSKKSTETFKQALNWATRNIMLIAIPAACGLFILALPLYASLFSYGEFTASDALMTSKSLCAFTIGLPAFMSVKVLASAFYAQKQIKTPVKIAITAVVANIVLNFILIHPLGYIGLALATALSSTLNAVLLWYTLQRQRLFHFSKTWLVYLLRVVFASSLMLAVLWYFKAPAQQWFVWHGLARVTHLFMLILTGILTYGIALAISGMRLHHLRDY